MRAINEYVDSSQLCKWYLSQNPGQENNLSLFFSVLLVFQGNISLLRP